jgi:hypothetical protein
MRRRSRALYASFVASVASPELLALQYCVSEGPVNSGETVSLTVTDDLTLDKFKDKRIVIGDEMRARFDNKDGNESKYFRKTAGC